MSLGSRLKSLIKYRKTTQKKLAKSLNISPSTLNNYVTDYRTPDYNTIIQLSNALHCNISYLLNTEIKENTVLFDKIEDDNFDIDKLASYLNIDYNILMGYLCGQFQISKAEEDALFKFLNLDNKVLKQSNGVKIPVLGVIPAGIPIEAVEDVLGYEEITPKLASTGEFFALKVKGDSMLPDIKNGDILIVRQQEDAENGDTCVIMVNGNDATVKKIKKMESGIMLIPNNSDFETMFFSNEEILSLPVRIIGKAIEIRRSL